MPLRVSFLGIWASEEFRELMLRRVSELRIEGFVEFPGVLSGEAKWNHFRHADLMCFPSYFDSEAFPLSLIEGLSFGLPIVSTRWRGIPDLVEDGVSGILVPPRDISAFAEAVKILASDAELRKRMAENARRRYLAQYTMEKLYERMGQVFLTTGAIEESLAAVARRLEDQS
jgi:glycosyltransferase involved in cell wall biosynthesis